MKSDYLHLLDRDHLLNLAKIYLDALRGKEEEVDHLTSELMNTRGSLESTQVALREAKI